MIRNLLLVSALTVLAIGCAAPRSVLWDGTTVERWHVQGNVAMAAAIPSATLGALAGSQMDAAKSMLGGGVDSLASQETYDNALKTVVAAGLDMPGVNPVLAIHLGIGWQTEIGFRREGSVNVWSLRRQFLKADSSGWNVGAGIQYSSQDYELPSALGKVQSTLGYTFERKDILLPLVFSKPFGPQGLYGSGTVGLVGGWTRIQYGFDPKGLYRTWGGKVDALESLPQQESAFLTYGATGVLRGGYKYAWAVVGLSVFYQNYGSYVVPGSSPIELSGVSVIPVGGLELRF